MNLGRLVLVENSAHRGDSHYNQLTFVKENGVVEQVLFTDRELNVARDRAVKNFNDVSGVSWLDRIAAFKINVFSKLISMWEKFRA